MNSINANYVQLDPRSPSGRRPWRGWAFLLPILLLLAMQSHSQATSGAVVGTVYDASGAAIPNTTITATNVATGAHRNVQSSSQGYYSIPSLPPGPYTLTATAAGFATTTVKLTVLLGQSATNDFHLSAGNVTQNVQVSASSDVQLDTTSHQVAATIPTENIENLPASGRDVFQVLQSAPNVSPFQNSPGPIANFRTTTQSLTIGGSASGMSTYLQDGVTNIAMLTKTANFQPSIEATQEVSIVANGAEARFDEPSVVNVITKNGTNTFNGRAYDYFQNDKLNTIGYFNRPKPPLRYNQFGANLGGPIIKDKLFFFFDYAGLRNSTGTTLYGYVPTLAERGGDFSADNFTIYDPSTYNPTTGTISAFPGNKIPSGRVNAFGSMMMSFLPTPTGSSIPKDNFQENVGDTTTYDSYLGRIDYTIGASDSLYGAYESTNPYILNPSFIPNPIYTYYNTQSAKNAYAQETHIFTPNALNIIRFAYNESNIFYSTLGTGKANYLQQTGIQNLNPAQSQNFYPQISFTTHSSFGSTTSPQGAFQRLFEFADEWNLTRGKNTLYVGGELDRIGFDGNWLYSNDGGFTFNGQYTSNHNAAHLTGGSDLADLLLGYAAKAQGSIGATVASFVQWNVMPYVQDDWRITSRLTANLGMRYDYYGAPSDSGGHSNVYDVYNNTNHPGTFRQEYLTFSPRVGLAYALPHDAVIHAGYGVYYSPFQYNQLQFLMINPPNFYLQNYTYNLSQAQLATNDFVAHPSLSAQAPFTIQPNMRTPYVQQWNLSVEKSLGPAWMAKLTYLGNRSDHLQVRQNPNQAAPPTDPAHPSPIQSRRPYSYVGDVFQIASIGYGNYNALQAELERHFTAGLSLSVNYVWSKSLDALNNGAATPEYGPDIQAEYGLSDFNPAQVFKASGLYQLPFGTGRQFLNGSNWFDRQVIGGWQTSGILAIQSGLPFNTAASDLSDTGSYHAQRGNELCNGGNPHGQSILHWFNTACYAQPAFGQLGTERRDNLIGPRMTNLDASFFKQFPVHEGIAVQFRSDFLDAFNHPHLGTPVASVTAPTYGEVTNITGNRIIQLSLKLIY